MKKIHILIVLLLLVSSCAKRERKHPVANIYFVVDTTLQREHPEVESFNEADTLVQGMKRSINSAEEAFAEIKQYDRKRGAVE